MPFSVKTFSMFILLIIGLPSMDGNRSNDQETNRRRNLRPILNTPNDEIIFKTGIVKAIKPNGFHPHGLRGNQGSTQRLKSLTYLQKAEEMRLKNQHKKKVLGTHQQLITTTTSQGMDLASQILTNAKENTKRKATEPVKQSEEIGRNSYPKNLMYRFLFKVINQGPYFGSSIATLWRRGEEQSADVDKLEKDHQKMKEHHPTSNTASKLKVIFHPITDALSKAKHKIKPIPTITGTRSKATRTLSIGLMGQDAVKTGLNKGLTSGYASKPSGLGQMTTEFPGEEGYDPVPHREASQPRRQVQTAKRRGSKWFRGSKHSAHESEIIERSPPGSPSSSFEQRQMWDFINRVSKKFEETGDLPAINEEPEQSEQTEDSKADGSKSPERRVPDTYQDKTQKDSLTQQTTPSFKHVYSPNIKTVESEKDIEKQEDKNIFDYIIRCKKGWKESGENPAYEENQTPFDKSPAPRTSQSSSQLPTGSLQGTTVQSPPLSPKGSPPRSPTRSLPQSPKNSKPRSPIRRPPSSQPSVPSNHHQWSNNANTIPRQQLRQLSNKEINDQYINMSNKIRSSDER